MFELCVRWFILGVDASLKAAFLALLAAAALRLLRIRDSNVRHRVWAGVLGGMLMLPALTTVVPAFGLPLALDPDWFVALLSSSTAEPSGENAPSGAAGSESEPVYEGAQPELAESDPLPAGIPREPGFENGWDFRLRGGTFERLPGSGAFEPDGARAADEHEQTDEAQLAAALSEQAPAAASSRWTTLLTYVPGLLCGVWLFGTLIMSLRLIAGLWIARKLCRESVAIDQRAAGLIPVVVGGMATGPEFAARHSPATLFDQVQTARHLAGGSHARSPHPGPLPGGEGDTGGWRRQSVPVFECPLIRVPVTIGLWRPRILLPAEWIDWPPEKLEAILAHERTHAERADCLCTFVAEINRCLYWFHPLAWWLRRQLSTLAEAACDDAAIGSTGDRAQYARHLLEVASAVSLQQGRLLPIAVSMARLAGVEARINAILDFTRPLSKRLTWASTIALVVVIAPIIGIAAALRPAPQAQTAAALAAADDLDGREEASDAAASIEEERANDIALANGASERGNSAPVSDADATFVFAGRVVDVQGKPVEGAKIKIEYERQPLRESNAAPLASTDGNGRFRCSRRRSDFRDSVAGAAFIPELIATRDGYGFASAPALHFETTGELTSELSQWQRHWLDYSGTKKSDVLTLVADDVPVRGRILNAEGRPVVGAKAEVISVQEGNEATLDAWEAATKEPGANLGSLYAHLHACSNGGFLSGPRPLAVPPAHTGTDGMFTLTGLGRDRIAELLVSGPEIETAHFYVRSRDGETLRLSSSGHLGSAADETFYPCEFTHVVVPGARVNGRVVDSRTGDPIAGIHVWADQLANVPVAGTLRSIYTGGYTDADGRFAIAGLPLGKSLLLAVPPLGSNHLAGGVPVTAVAGPDPLACTIELAAGILVRGRAVDGETGRPVQGIVQYFADMTNPNLQYGPSVRRGSPPYHYYQTDADGRFAIPALPGKGILAFLAHDHGRYPHGAGADAIDTPREEQTNFYMFRTEPNACVPDTYNVLVGIDPRREDRELTVNFTLGAGASISGRIVAPDGQELKDFYVLGDQSDNRWWRWHAGEGFEVKGYFPREKRRLMFYHPVRDLVGLDGLTGPPPEKLEVKLRPAARIAGRVVDGDGLPLERVQLAAAWLTGRDMQTDKTGEENRGVLLLDPDSKPVTTDEQGRFELRGIIPGMKYSAGVNGWREPDVYQSYLGTIFSDVTCQLGETKQLGDLQVKKPKAESNDNGKENTRSEAADHRNPTFVYEGTVVEEAGKPVAGATVALDGWRKIGLPNGEPAAATTDERGRFRFVRKKSEFVEAGMRGSWAYARLIARKDGFGFATGPSAHFETTGELDRRLDDEQRRIIELDSGKKTNVLTLIADVPIRGRIVDTQGQPVAGAKVEVINIWRGEEGTLVAWEAASKERGADAGSVQKHLRMLIGGHFLSGPRAAAVLPLHTGADGSFVLKGLGRDRIAETFVSGPGIETRMLRIRSRAGETIKLPQNFRSSREAEYTYYPAQFTHVAGPSTPLTGRVTDGKSGEPLAGVWLHATQVAGVRFAGGLEAEYIRTTTDAEGRYRLEGLPVGQNTLLFLPSPGMHNLAGEVSVPVPASGVKPFVHDMALAPAVLVRGRVSDKQTGTPLDGHVQYFAYESNPRLQHAGAFRRANLRFTYWVQNGEFEIPVLAGKGILAFTASDHEKFPRGAGADAIDCPRLDGRFLVQPWCIPHNFHLLTPLNIADDARELTLNLSLASGANISGRALTAEGQVLDEYFINGELAQGGWNRNPSKTFAVKGYFPDEGRRVMVYHPAKDLSGVRSLTGAPPETIDVVLTPAATITGRLVDADGLPVENAVIDDERPAMASPADSPPRPDLTRGELLDFLDGKRIVTDAQGRFVLKGIIPGLKYTARASRAPESGNPARIDFLGTIFTGLVCQPGETKQLGDIKVKKAGDLDANGAPIGTGAQVKSGAGQSTAAGNEKKDHDFRFTGRVLDPQGSPAAGAIVRIDALRRRRFDAYGEPYTSAPVVTLTADASGRFERTVKESALPEDYVLVQVTASKPGFGLAIESYSRLDQTFELTLSTDERVRGRVIDLEGRPVANVRIDVQEVCHSDQRWVDRWLAKLPARPRLRGIASATDESIDSLLANASGEEAPSFPARSIQSVAPEMLPSAKSDAEGRFEIAGLGRDRLLLVRAIGPGVAAAQHYVLTRPMQPVAFAGRRGESVGFTLFGSELEFVAQPSIPLEGIVIDDETGTPIAGAIVASESLPGVINHGEGLLSTATDGRGWYRLEGLPATAESSIKVAPVDAPYFVLDDINVPRSEGSRPLRRDIRLKRGVWAAGRAYDMKTDRPVAGEIFYTPFVSNDNSKLYAQFQGGGRRLLVYLPSGRTDADGRFRVPVIPGRGVICFRALQTEAEFRPGFGSSAIKEFADGTAFKASPWPLHDDFTPWTFHAIREINPPVDVAATAVDIPLDPGQDVTLKFVDGAGRKLSGVAAHWWRPYFNSVRSNNDGALTLRAVSPDDTYTIRFEDKGTGFSKLLRFRPLPGETERTLTLEPPAIVTGRLIDPDGQPLHDVGIRAEYDLGYNSINGVPSVKTDADGKFWQKLPAGAAFQIAVREPWFASLRADLSVATGEEVNLGTYVIEVDDRNRAKVTRQGEEKRAEPAQKRSVKEANDGTESTIRVRGKIVDKAGKPLAAAKLYVPRLERNPPHSVFDAELQLVGTADAQGEFSVSVPETNPIAPGVADNPLVAAHPEMAVNWIGVSAATARTPQEITLQPEQVIRGRVVDTEGRPVAGARILAETLAAPLSGNSLDPFFAAWLDRPLDASRKTLRRSNAAFAALISARSDADGHFELHGVAAESICHVRIAADPIASTNLWIVNRVGFDSQPYVKRWQETYGTPRFVAQDFVHVCQPTLVVEGRVTTEGNGPAAGVHVQAQTAPPAMVGGRPGDSGASGSAVTDRDGRYHITGLRRGEPFTIRFEPPGTSDLLSRGETAEPDAGAAVKMVDAQLRRGIPVSGRVYDPATGRGVFGSVLVAALPDNEDVKQGRLRAHEAHQMATTDAQGRYRVIVVSGSTIIGSIVVGGKVRVGDQMIDPFRRARPPEKYPDLRGEFTATRLLNYSLDAGPQTVDLELDRGKTADVEFADPDGAPIEGVFVSGLAESPRLLTTARLTEPRCTIYALGADQPRKVIALHAERRLCGVATLTGDERAPVKVPLVPTATLRGRAVDASGQPLAGVLVRLKPDARYEDTTAQYLYRNHAPAIGQATADATGKFEIPLVVPGERFVLAATVEGSELQDQPANERHALAPGQSLDLGNVTFAPPRRDISGQSKSAKPAAEIGAATKTANTKPEGKETADAGVQVPASTSRRARGRVVDTSGKPISGAALHIPAPIDSPLQVRGDRQLVEKGRSDAEGKFELATDEAEFGEPPRAVPLIVSHPGFGIEWLDLPHEGDVPPAEIVLHSERPIHGRLVDTEGRPVAGGIVSLHKLGGPKANGGVDSFLTMWNRNSRLAFSQLRWLNFGIPPELLGAKTDEEGKFTLRGVASERVCQIQIEAGHYARSAAMVVNRDGFDSAAYKYTQGPRTPRGVYHPQLAGPEFTQVATTGLVVEGRVTAEDGTPAKGIAVSAFLFSDTPVSAVTSEEGRYRLSGFEPGQPLLVRFASGNDSDSLAQTVSLRTRADEMHKPLDVALRRGVVVTGRVIDPLTREGVAGSIRFVPLPGSELANQPGFDSYSRDQIGRPVAADGTFRLPVMPGPGVLMVVARGARVNQLSPFREGFVSPEDVDKIKITTRPGGIRTFTMANGGISPMLGTVLKYVDFPAGSPAQTVDIELDRGKTVELELVDAAGKPIEGAIVAGIAEQAPSTIRLTGSHGTVYALGADRPRKLLVLHTGRRLAASATLTGDERSPVRIELQKAASIRGRAVDEAGQPIANADLFLGFSHELAYELDRFRDADQPRLVTDKEGRFRIVNLIPGEPCQISIRQDEGVRPSNLTAEQRTLSAGQDLDAGDVTFGPLRRMRAGVEGARTGPMPAASPRSGVDRGGAADVQQ